jgi:hypothetical protein
MEALLALLVPLLIMTIALLLELVEARLLQARALPRQQPEPVVPDEQPPRRPQVATNADDASIPPRRAGAEPTVSAPRQDEDGDRPWATSSSASNTAERM